VLEFNISFSLSSTKVALILSVVTSMILVVGWRRRSLLIVARVVLYLAMVEIAPAGSIHGSSSSTSSSASAPAAKEKEDEERADDDYAECDPSSPVVP